MKNRVKMFKFNRLYTSFGVLLMMLALSFFNRTQSVSAAVCSESPRSALTSLNVVSLDT